MVYHTNLSEDLSGIYLKFKLGAEQQIGISSHILRVWKQLHDFIIHLDKSRQMSMDEVAQEVLTRAISDILLASELWIIIRFFLNL